MPQSEDSGRSKFLCSILFALWHLSSMGIKSNCPRHKVREGSVKDRYGNVRIGPLLTLLPKCSFFLGLGSGGSNLIMKHLSFLSFPFPQLIQLQHLTLSIISSLWQQESKSRRGKLIIIVVSRHRMQSEFNVEANTNTNKPYLF